MQAIAQQATAKNDQVTVVKRLKYYHVSNENDAELFFSLSARIKKIFHLTVVILKQQIAMRTLTKCENDVEWERKFRGMNMHLCI